MSFIATAILGSGALGAGASIFGASEQAGAEQNAAGTIAGSTQSAIQQLMSLIQQGAGQVGQYTSQATQALQPFVNTGEQAGGTLASLLNPGTAASTLTQLPGYQFNLNSGLWGVNNAATTSGLGGNVLTSANNFAQGTASNTWGTLVNSLQNLFSTGAGAAGGQASALSGAGSSLASLFGNAGQNVSGLTQSAGQNIAQTQVGAANAAAGGATGAASALGGSVSSLTNLALLKNLLGGGGGMFGTGGTGNITTGLS